MSEELKKTDIKKIAGRGCLIVAGILFLIFLCRYNQIKKESLYDTEGRTFAKATVMNVLQDNETKDGIYIGRQLVKLKITSGKWKGKIMEADSSSAYLYGAHCKKDIAMCFGGAMAASGMLGSITSVFLRFMKRTVGLVTSTVASGLFLNICTADQYISIILTGNMFKDIYEKKGYESRLLSRTVEDSVTVTSVLIPWNTCGMTQATILGVATFIYLPYCFFNLISPLMSITIAAIGFKIKRKNEKAKSVVAG